MVESKRARRMAARSAKKDLIRLREEAKRNQKMQASSRKEYENDNLSKPNRLNSSENESMKENIKNDANASAPQIVQENSLSPNAENQNIMSSLNSNEPNQKNSPANSTNLSILNNLKNISQILPQYNGQANTNLIAETLLYQNQQNLNNLKNNNQAPELMRISRDLWQGVLNKASFLGQSQNQLQQISQNQIATNKLDLEKSKMVDIQINDEPGNIPPPHRSQNSPNNESNSSPLDDSIDSNTSTDTADLLDVCLDDLDVSNGSVGSENQADDKTETAETTEKTEEKSQSLNSSTSDISNPSTASTIASTSSSLTDSRFAGIEINEQTKTIPSEMNSFQSFLKHQSQMFDNNSFQSFPMGHLSFTNPVNNQSMQSSSSTSKASTSSIPTPNQTMQLSSEPIYTGHNSGHSKFVSEKEASVMNLNHEKTYDTILKFTRDRRMSLEWSSQIEGESVQPHQIKPVLKAAVNLAGIDEHETCSNASNVSDTSNITANENQGGSRDQDHDDGTDSVASVDSQGERRSSLKANTAAAAIAKILNMEEVKEQITIEEDLPESDKLEQDTIETVEQENLPDEEQNLEIHDKINDLELVDKENDTEETK